MSLLLKGDQGITALSGLAIDVNKDWAGRSIKHLGSAVDGTDAVTLQDVIFLTGAVNRVINPPILQIPHPTLSKAATEDHSGGGSTATTLLATAMPTLAKATILSPGLAIDGAVQHQQSPLVDTDETAAANDAVANDMHLLLNPPSALGDGYYWGLASPWDWLLLNIGTAGAGVWTMAWKYWNGAIFAPLTLLYDETSNFRVSGMKRVHFVRPGGWALSTIAGLNLYWIKAELTAYTSMSTQPLGTQAWAGQY